MSACCPIGMARRPGAAACSRRSRKASRSSRRRPRPTSTMACPQPRDGEIALFVPPDDGAGACGGGAASHQRWSARGAAARGRGSICGAVRLADYRGADVGGLRRHSACLASPNESRAPVAAGRAVMAVLERPDGGRAPSPPRARLGRAWLRGEAIPLVLLALLTLLGGRCAAIISASRASGSMKRISSCARGSRCRSCCGTSSIPARTARSTPSGWPAGSKLFGTSEVAVRLPSAIAGTLAIPAMYAPRPDAAWAAPRPDRRRAAHHLALRALVRAGREDV